ncbi:hypothetical protein [Pseudomonas sp. TMB3-21]
MNIDWSKAPHWAKRHGFNSFNQAAWIGEKNYQYVEDIGIWEFGTTGYELSAFHGLTERPVVWTGEGLPPVGTELEAGFACEEFEMWHKGVCVAVGEDPEGREEFCVVKFGNKLAMYTDEGRRMRPIRTPERIAADEREAACRQLLKDCYQDENAFALIQAGRLYDAGWRKQAAQ